MTENKNSTAWQIRQIGLLTTVPIVLLIGPLVGFTIGRWLDQKFHTQPYLSLWMVLLGFYASAREIRLILKQVQRSQTPKKEKK